MCSKISQAIFLVTPDAVQAEAVRSFGRRLTDEELLIVKKGVESGLSFDIDIILKAAIEEAMLINKEK